MPAVLADRLRPTVTIGADGDPTGNPHTSAALDAATTDPGTASAAARVRCSGVVGTAPRRSTPANTSSRAPDARLRVTAEWSMPAAAIWPTVTRPNWNRARRRNVASRRAG